MQTANDDNEVLEGLEAFAWTERTVTSADLCRLLGTWPRGENSPIEVCSGAYVVEHDGAGDVLHWRFYRRPAGTE